MRILHIGWGFRPWRGGGIIEYAEDLMEKQIQKGWEVLYFFSGRHFLFIKRPKLLKWKRKGILMFEIINSPIFHGSDGGTLSPQKDMQEPWTEKFFRKVLKEENPDILYIQEMAGLPISLIKIAKDEFNIPTIMILHDYFLLCPTLKLMDYNGNLCTVKENIGDRCVKCCEYAPKNNRYLIKKTLTYYLKRIYLYKPLKLFSVTLKRIYNLIISHKNNPVLDTNYGNDLSNLFQKRRIINLNSLKKIDLFIAVSNKVNDIYKNFLKIDNIITLQVSTKHLDYIFPKRKEMINFPITFLTLNGCSSERKGSKLMYETIKMLNFKGLDSYFELHIWGSLDKNIKNILKFKNVYYHGSYNVENLNYILEKADVGIVPSIWEEAYGLVGIELLAKGIPVIGNKRGGIVDYTIDNYTGWINKSATAQELANIIEKIIKNPRTISELNKNILENSCKILKTIEQHFQETKDIYYNVINCYR